MQIVRTEAIVVCRTCVKHIDKCMYMCDNSMYMRENNMYNAVVEKNKSEPLPSRPFGYDQV